MVVILKYKRDKATLHVQWHSFFWKYKFIDNCNLTKENQKKTQILLSFMETCKGSISDGKMFYS